MQDRGQLLERAVRASGMSIKAVADQAKISRNTLYEMFKRSDISIDQLLEIGKIIKHDFISELPELSTVLHTLSTLEDSPSKHSSPLDDCRNELLSTQRKLVTAMEVISKYQAKYGAL